MLATELLFVHVYCLVDDAIKAGDLWIPRRPGPAPDCTDAELVCIALARHLLGRRSENGFLAEIRRDGPGLFPQLPDQPQVNRRTRWLWGAFEQLRAAWAAAVPPARSGRPAPPRSRSRTPPGSAARTAGPARATTWPPGSAATARTPDGPTASAWPSALTLGRRIIRAWSLAPAAAGERQTGADLAAGDAAAIGALLLDKGFTGRRFAAEMAGAGIEVIIPPTRVQRQAMPENLQRLIARRRNRVETSFKEITDQMELARHGAHTFDGLLTRTVATLAAHTLLLTLPPEAI